MDKNIMDIKKFRRIFWILVVVSILFNIKSILSDYNLDSGYAVVMSYRQATGEMLLSEMWEPHQTSAFLSALLIKIYLRVMKTTTGIVLYLQAAGVLIRGLFCMFFWQSMKNIIRKDMLMLMCLFFFSVTPKGLPIPEFSNMQVWFAVGLICSLVRYFQEQTQKCWLILAGVFLCLEILSYPSCVIVYVGVVYLIARYVENKRKDIGIFTGVCVCGGGLYCGWLLRRLGVEDILEGIWNIVSGDSSHSLSLIAKFKNYILESIHIFFFFFIIGFLAYIILKIVNLICKHRKGRREKICTVEYWTIFFLLNFVCELSVILATDMDYCIQVPLYIPILLLGMFFYNCCNEKEKQIFLVGVIVSTLNFFATLMLTNSTVKSSLSYMIPAIMTAAIPIVRGIEKSLILERRRGQYGLLFLFCALVIFRSGYLFSVMSGPKTNFLSLGGIVKEGPAVGIVSEYMGPYIFNFTMQEWKEWINDGDSVLIVGNEAYDPLPYLFRNVQISTPSTICTPTYDEKLLEYWEKYPEKYPDVIIVDCWYGDLRVDENSWIMQWLQKEYPECDYVDGQFWRYYRLRNI